MAVEAIVTDIEGTTSSIAFVHEVLFPYAREHMEEFVRAHAGEPAVREQLAAVYAEVGRELSLEEGIEQLIAWLDADRKITPLKALQGMIWLDGYHSGAFTGHVYEDAARNLRHWQQQGRALYVFSSGSVAAQRLIFGYSDFGDLTPLFSGYFDTNIGAKREAGAYRNVLAAIGHEAARVLFLSDIVEELDAAAEAGMQTIQLVRDGEPAPQAAHRQAVDFDEVDALLE